MCSSTIGSIVCQSGPVGVSYAHRRWSIVGLRRISLSIEAHLAHSRTSLTGIIVAFVAAVRAEKFEVEELPRSASRRIECRQNTKNMVHATGGPEGLPRAVRRGLMAARASVVP